MSRSSLVAILTDFGSMDPFTGIMKGVITTITPQTRVIDLTNDIPPGDIQRAAVNLWQSQPYFPKGTIFLCVVDPGVGTSRKGIFMQSGDFIYIGPDNGLFTFVAREDSESWELSNPNYLLPKIGSTFHGRDIFAPAAAYAALGVSGSKFGPSVSKPVVLPDPRLELIGTDAIGGEILYADRFGNLLTSIGQFERRSDQSLVFDPWILNKGTERFESKINPAGISLELEDGSTLSWVDTFGEVPAGECAFLLGSSGLIEIAANRKSAKEMLNLNRGDRVTLRIEGEPHG